MRRTHNAARVLTLLSIIALLASLSFTHAQAKDSSPFYAHKRNALNRLPLVPRQATTSAGAGDTDATSSAKATTSDADSQTTAAATSTAATTSSSSSSEAVATTSSAAQTTTQDTQTSTSPASTSSATATTSQETTTSTASTAAASTTAATTSTASVSSSSTSSTISSTTPTSTTAKTTTAAADATSSTADTLTPSAVFSRATTASRAVSSGSTVSASSTAAASSSSSSFFDNKSAVAGVFSVVGIIGAAVVSYFGWYFIKKRRLARERELEDEDFGRYEKNMSEQEAQTNSHNGHNSPGSGDEDPDAVVVPATENAYPTRDIHYGNDQYNNMGRVVDEDDPLPDAVPRGMLYRKPTYSGVEFPPGTALPEGTSDGQYPHMVAQYVPAPASQRPAYGSSQAMQQVQHAFSDPYYRTGQTAAVGYGQDAYAGIEGGGYNDPRTASVYSTNYAGKGAGGGFVGMAH